LSRVSPVQYSPRRQSRRRHTSLRTVEQRHRPRSAEVDTCLEPRTQTRLGDRSFTVSGPPLWNSLPATLRRSDTELAEFELLLRTRLHRVDETAAH